MTPGGEGDAAPGGKRDGPEQQYTQGTQHGQGKKKRIRTWGLRAQSNSTKPLFPDTSRRVQLQGTGNRASRAHNATTRTTWVENHRDRFSFPRATFSPLGATPVDRRFFEIGVFPAPRARADGGTCTGHFGHFCFCVLLACVLHIRRQPGSNAQYKFVQIRSCAWVLSYRVRVDHVSLTALKRWRVLRVCAERAMRRIRLDWIGLDRFFPTTPAERGDEGLLWQRKPCCCG